MSLVLYPLTEQRWNDFEILFGSKGACGGCWCMYWRLRNADYQRMKGDSNRQAMFMLVKSKEPLGFLAYIDRKVAGWISVSPREAFVRLDTSRTLKPIDDKTVWSISCFFISKDYRKKGLSTQILKQLIQDMKKSDVKILEAYPVNPRNKSMADAFAWTGISNSFIKAGFKIASKPTEARTIMRYYL